MIFPVLIESTLNNFFRVPEVYSVLADDRGAEAHLEAERERFKAEEEDIKETEGECYHRLKLAFYKRIEAYGITLDEFYFCQKSRFCRFVIASNYRKLVEMDNATMTLTRSRRPSYTLEESLEMFID